MTRERTRAVIWSAPFALWLAMLMAFPATPEWYAVRTAAVAALGLGCLLAARTRFSAAGASSVLLAAAVGLGVFFLWVFPERFPWYAQHLVLCAGGPGASGAPSPYETAPGWLLAVKIFGSAFVIAPAEEVFFRGFLYRRLQSPRWLDVPANRFDPSAFAWTVGLFALEHDRPLVAALAGACYGFACMRGGVGCAVAAHALTNLALGVWVVARHAWQFW